MCTKRFGSFVNIRKQWRTSLYDKEGLTFHFSYFYNWKSLDNVEIKIADWLFLHHRSAHKQQPHPWIVWCVGSTQGHGGQKAHFSLCHYCIRTDSLWSMWLLRIKKADLLFHSRSNYSFQCLYCELAGVAVPPIDNSVLLLSGRAEMMTLESEGGKGRWSLRTTHTHARGASHTHQNTFSLNRSKCFGECETRGGQAAFHCSADETEGCTSAKFDQDQHAVTQSSRCTGAPCKIHTGPSSETGTPACKSDDNTPWSILTNDPVIQQKVLMWPSYNGPGTTREPEAVQWLQLWFMNIFSHFLRFRAPLLKECRRK